MRRSFFAIGLFACTAALHAASGPFTGKVAFTTTRDGNEEIYVMSPNGAVPARLTTDPAADSMPAFSPDGKKIAFVSDRDGNAEIYVMNANGTEQTRLTTSTETDEHPSWSPDGQRIVFQSTRRGNSEIFLMGATGGIALQLTNSFSSDSDPSFSGDGTKIVFASDRDGNFEIYSMNPNGTGQTRLTNSTASDTNPHVSRDGKRIVFTTQVVSFGSHPQVATMTAAGAFQTVLTSGSVNNFPEFSPDGKKIFFESRRDGGNKEIYSMNADGSSQTRVTSNTAADTDPALQTVFQAESIGVYRPTTGQWFLRNTLTPGPQDIILQFGGQPGDLPVTGNWNGDERTDIGIFRNGTFLLANVFTAFGSEILQEHPALAFGQPGDLPVAGDWNGDGKDDVGVFRPGPVGRFLLRNPVNNGFVTIITTLSFDFGTAGDLPVAGDWDGDGIETVGVYRGTTSPAPFLLSDTFTGTIDHQFDLGEPGDQPIAGDWLGAGADRTGLFREPDIFFLAADLSPKGGLFGQLGQPGDLPVAGNWSP